MKRFTALFAAALALAAFRPTSAQEGEHYPDDAPAPDHVVIVERTVNLRRDPSVARRPLATFTRGRELTLVSPADIGGFYHVVTESGAQGWVWANNVRVEVATGAVKARLTPPQTFKIFGVAPDFATRAAAAPVPCRPFDECTDDGCDWEDPTSAHALVNRTKRRPPQTSRARLLSFADFDGLQRQADRIFRRQPVALDSAGRQRLRRMTVSGGAVNEGDLVRISGFVVGDPHANPRESVNCKQKTSDLSDYHINIAPAFQGKPEEEANEFRGIVIEMIPQEPRRRSGAWDLSKVRKAMRDKRRVLVEGALFYDNIHKVRPSDALPGLSNQPRRFSLWEVHPVTGFYVCMRDGGDCDPRRPAGWTPLERF